jgi:hypothetical protein
MQTYYTSNIKKFNSQNLDNFPVAPGYLVPPGYRLVLRNPYRVFRIRVWQFLVTCCPFCGQSHIHGGVPPEDIRELGPTRAAHCRGQQLGW